MAYFAADPSIRVIVVYLEGVRNTKSFRDACKAARANGKPIIALKLGASEGGRAAAMAHTGALAGSIETFDAISTREGVIRVRGLDELIETTECFVHVEAAEERPPRRRHPLGRQARADDRRVLFGRPELQAAEPGLQDKLGQMLGPGSIVGNPLDAGFAAVVDPTVYIKSVQLMIEDPDTDIVMIDAEFPKAPHELRERNIRLVNDMAGAAVKARGLYQRDVGRLHRVHQGAAQIGAECRRDAGHRPRGQRDQAADRLRRAAQERAGRESSRARRQGGAGEGAEVGQGRRARRGRLEEAAEGLRHPGVEGRDRAPPPTDAAKIAKTIGFPVVAKVVSEQILHKSDVGGVVLNLKTAAEVKKAFNDIMAG